MRGSEVRGGEVRRGEEKGGEERGHEGQRAKLSGISKTFARQEKASQEIATTQHQHENLTNRP